jgi:ribonuclease Z
MRAEADGDAERTAPTDAGRNPDRAMTWLVQPRLINDPFSDPTLFVDFRFGSRALLFDLGDVSSLSSRELLRVSHAFVSHTHMDHFSGFDRLLRICLHRMTPLHLFGPPGFNDQVEHKLRAYTWNLLGEESFDFTITATEVSADGCNRAGEFRAREAFHRREQPAGKIAPDKLLEEDDFHVAGALLDHGTACLAFALQERIRVNVWKEGLASLGLPVGPWLEAAKRAVRRGAPDEYPIPVGDGSSIITLGLLKARALRVARGQKIAYVVDASYSEPNIGRIVGLARDADQLFIETAFLQQDAALAAERRHLTAAQAGRIARLAGVSRLVPMHFSARYLGREDQLRREAEAAFRKP